MTTPKPNGPKVEVPADLEAQYSNLVVISHTPAELVLDFARLLPGQPAAKVVSRLLMSPSGAKMLFRALGENLARYEAAFGAIPVPHESGLANDLFRTIHPPEKPEE